MNFDKVMYVHKIPSGKLYLFLKGMIPYFFMSLKKS